MRPLLGRPFLCAFFMRSPARALSVPRQGACGRDGMDQLVLVTIYSPVTQLTIAMFLAV